MAKSADKCLAVYPTAEFSALAEKLRETRTRGGAERQTARSFFAGAIEIIPDKQGRVAIPANLREYAGLDRDVTVAGNLDHIEIWDAQLFREKDREGTAALAGGVGIDDFA